jgi:hypothetical protein
VPARLGARATLCGGHQGVRGTPTPAGDLVWARGVRRTLGHDELGPLATVEALAVEGRVPRRAVRATARTARQGCKQRLSRPGRWICPDRLLLGRVCPDLCALNPFVKTQL